MLSCSLARGAVASNDPVKWRAADWDLNAARLGSVFREEFAKAGLAPATTPNLFETGPTADKFQVAALITDMDGRFCWDSGPVYSGLMRMSVEWQVFDNFSRQVVKRIPTTAGGDEAKTSADGVERVFFAAFRENVRALLASTEFRGMLTGATGAPTGAMTPLSFTRPPTSKRSIPEAAQAVAAIFAGDGHGSGFLISSDGYVVTNRHVAGGAKYVKVRFADGVESLGEVVRSDSRRDVALVKVQPGARIPLPLRPNPTSAGETVFAIGTPLDPKFEGTVTKGIVSANRTYEGLSFIQSDVVINGGNSGGPLLDENGAVIGICVSGYDINGAPVGINLFIPIEDALKVLALAPAA